MIKVLEKGRAKISEIDVILRDLHLDTRTERSVLLSKFVPELECAREVWKRKAKSVKHVGTVQMTTAKKYWDAHNDGQYSIDSRVGTVPTQNKEGHEEIESAILRRKHAKADIAGYSW